MTTLEVSTRTGRSGKRSRDALRVAALHAQGDAWRIVVAEGGAEPRLLAAESLRAEDAEGVRALLDRHDVGRLIRLAPAGEALVRIADVPAETALDDSALDEALQLLAESELPASVPAHRQAAGLLRTAGGVATPIIVGWPDRGRAITAIDVERERWTSELVPLLALAGMGGAQREAQVACYACPGSGSIGVVGLNGAKTAVRGVPEPGDDASLFAERTERAYQELAAHMGAADRSAPAPGRRLTVDAEACTALARELRGAEASADWCDRYGLAAATALTALLSGDSAQRLLALQLEAPRARHGKLERALSHLATTNGAVLGIVIAVGAVLLVSAGAAWAQAALLERRAEALRTALSATDETGLTVEDQLAVYSELDRARWPMVKVLADLTAAMPATAPDDVVLADSIEIRAGDSFLVRGTTDSLALVNRYVANLNESGVFTRADIRRYEAVGPGVRDEFEVEGLVARPYGTARGLPDFSGPRTVAHQIYGVEPDGEASGAASPSSSIARADSSKAQPADAVDAERRSRQSAPTFDGGERRAGGRSAEDIPGPLTDDEIAAMNQQTAFAEYTKRRRLARSRTDLTQEVRDRLLDEADKCRARAVEAKKESSS